MDAQASLRPLLRQTQADAKVTAKLERVKDSKGLLHFFLEESVDLPSSGIEVETVDKTVVYKAVGGEKLELRIDQPVGMRLELALRPNGDDLSHLLHATVALVPSGGKRGSGGDGAWVRTSLLGDRRSVICVSHQILPFDPYEIFLDSTAEEAFDLRLDIGGKQERDGRGRQRAGDACSQGEGTEGRWEVAGEMGSRWGDG
eukprot:4572878-Pleurochrysis_carterae.AAC.4